MSWKDLCCQPSCSKTILQNAIPRLSSTSICVFKRLCVCPTIDTLCFLLWTGDDHSDTDTSSQSRAEPVCHLLIYVWVEIKGQNDLEIIHCWFFVFLVQKLCCLFASQYALVYELFNLLCILNHPECIPSILCLLLFLDHICTIVRFRPASLARPHCFHILCSSPLKQGTSSSTWWLPLYDTHLRMP